MKLLFITVFTLIIPFCDCVYKGGYSKVTWNQEEKIYEQSDIDLGEPLLSVEFEFCNKKKKKLSLKGRVNNRDTFIGNDDTVNAEIVIVRCDRDGNILEEITTTKKDGSFDFETIRDKKGFLVFREKEKKQGARYDIKSFR